MRITIRYFDGCPIGMWPASELPRPCTSADAPMLSSIWRRSRPPRMLNGCGSSVSDCGLRRARPFRSGLRAVLPPLSDRGRDGRCALGPPVGRGDHPRRLDSARQRYGRLGRLRLKTFVNRVDVFDHRASPVWPRNPKGWGSREEEFVDRCLDTVEQRAPGFRASIVGVSARTPEPMMLTDGWRGAHPMHLDISLDQLGPLRPTRRLASHRTPVPNLVITGAGTSPTGGVAGTPGRLAARVALDILGTRGARTGRRRSGGGPGPWITTI